MSLRFTDKQSSIEPELNESREKQVINKQSSIESELNENREKQVIDKQSNIESELNENRGKQECVALLLWLRFASLNIGFTISREAINLYP